MEMETEMLYHVREFAIREAKVKTKMQAKTKIVKWQKRDFGGLLTTVESSLHQLS